MLGFTKEQIKEICERYDSQPETITKLQRKFRCPRWKITRVANLNGIGNLGIHRQWTDWEVDYLIDKFGIVDHRTICKRLNRTWTAIKLKAKRLGINMHNASGCWTGRYLTDRLGVDQHAIDAFKKHGLRTRRFKTLHPRPAHRIDPADWLAFLRKHPEAVDYMSLSYRRKVELGIIDSTVKDRMVLPIPPAEKLAVCRGCGNEFWTEIYESNPRCAKCGKLCSRFSEKFRGKMEVETPARSSRERWFWGGTVLVG